MGKRITRGRGPKELLYIIYGRYICIRARPYTHTHTRVPVTMVLGRRCSLPQQR